MTGRWSRRTRTASRSAGGRLHTSSHRIFIGSGRGADRAGWRMTATSAGMIMISRMRATTTRRMTTITRVMTTTRTMERKGGTGRKECGKIPLKSVNPDLKTEERTRIDHTQYIIESGIFQIQSTRNARIFLKMFLCVILRFPPPGSQTREILPESRNHRRMVEIHRAEVSRRVPLHPLFRPGRGSVRHSRSRISRSWISSRRTCVWLAGGRRISRISRSSRTAGGSCPLLRNLGISARNVTWRWSGGSGPRLLRYRG